MAENKKSFILYADMIHTVDKLPDEIAGKLLKIILQYVNDKNPKVDDLLLQVAFEPIKLQLKRDLVRWEDFKVKQSENGKLGGRPKKEINPKKPSLILESQKSLNATATVNVNVISKLQVVEFLRRATTLEISDADFEIEAEKLMKQYPGQKIGNLQSLCNRWMENIQTAQVMPVLKKERIGRPIDEILKERNDFMK